MIAYASDLVLLPDADVAVARTAQREMLATIVLSVAGAAVAVHFDDVESALAFRERYVDLLANGERVEHHVFAARNAAPSALFWSARGPVFRWPHGALSAQATAFLADAVAMTAVFEERGDGVISLHAAAVAVPGAAAAIVADSAGGKTTTAIACVRAGLALYGDERCVIDVDLRVHPFPRSINVRAGGARLLLCDAVPDPDPVGDRLLAHGQRDWNGVRLCDLLGAWTAPPLESLRAIFVIDGTGAVPLVGPISSHRAAHAAARWTQGAGTGIDKLARLIDRFSRIACYRLILGRPESTARTIRAALDACARPLVGGG